MNLNKTPSKIGKYRIIDFLGKGFFGFVFHAYDPFLQVDRAIKLIKVPNPQKFVNAVKEAQTLEQCRHKHIVDVKEVNVTFYEGIPYVCISMEYLAKGSIQKYMEQRFISIRKSLRIIEDSLLGLEHAHNQNILHRDIKPGNILIGNNDEIKLSDFGLAINYQIDDSNTFGYKPHQPLEVIRGQVMDKSSDIYAMGITFFRLINNIEHIDFDFSSQEDWEKAVKRKEYPVRNFLPHIPNKIVRIINKSIHNDINHRYRNTTEFRQAIEKINLKIDWVILDENNWIGLGDSEYKISKIKSRNGWKIHFKKNNRRVTDYCFQGLKNNEIDEKFFNIIKSTSI